MEDSDVPVYDPLDAYSMSLEIQPNNTAFSVQQSGTNAADFSRHQNSGVTVTPLGPLTSVGIHESLNNDKLVYPSHQQTLLPQLPKQPLSLAELEDYHQNSTTLHVQIPNSQSVSPTRLHRSPRAGVSPGSSTSYSIQISPVTTNVAPAACQQPVHVMQRSLSGAESLQTLQVSSGDHHDVPPPPSYQQFIRQNQSEATNLSVPSNCQVIVASAGTQPAVDNVVGQSGGTPGDRLINIPGHLVSPDINIPGHVVSPGKPPSQNHSPVKKSPMASATKEKGALFSPSQFDEFADVPGINLKKNTVNTDIYINTLVARHHPKFANIDSYAERCMACIFRKLRTSIRDLQKLSRVILNKEGSRPGACIKVRRAKDCRITVTRSGPDGAKATKKIHPHLALIQIFSNPQAQNINAIHPLEECKSPFLPGTVLPEMCINPFHYRVSLLDKIPKKPGPKPKSQLWTCLTESNLQKANPLLPGEDDSDSDCLSDSSGPADDWETAWTNQTKQSTLLDPVQMNLDESQLAERVKFLSLKRKSDESALCEEDPPPQKLLSKLRILEDLRCLARTQFDLSSVSTSTCDRPRTRTRKLVAKEKSNPLSVATCSGGTTNKESVDVVANLSSNAHSEPDNPSHRPSVILPNSDINSTASLSISSVTSEAPAVYPVKSESCHTNGFDADTSTNISLSGEQVQEANPVEEYTEKKKKQDELVIKDLLEDIKESFEADFDMDMDLAHFSTQEDQFSSQGFQGFSIANTFSISELNEAPQNDMSGLNMDNGGLRVADGMIGGVSDVMDREDADHQDTELPCIVDAWTDAASNQEDDGFMMYES